jgi:hypothetical protein
MDNEAEALNRKDKTRIGIIGGLMKPDGLHELFEAYPHVLYHVDEMYDSPLLHIKKPSQPPSTKPVEQRDEFDLARLRKAEEKRRKRASRRLDND